MTEVAVAVLLGASVLSAWLGTVGLVLLRGSFDRLHVVGFVTIVPGFFLTLAVLVQESFSVLALKQVALYVAAVLLGAVLTHSIGRTFRIRNERAEES